MRRFSCAVGLSALIASSSAWADPARYDLDPSHTTVFFTVEHIGYALTLGVFKDVSGSFVYDTDTRDLSDVTVTIQTASVDTFNGARDGHVRKRDFLDVKSHPQITFTASEGVAKDDTTGTVTGDLTILDRTLPVTLDVTLNKAAKYPFGHGRFTLGVSASTTIQRSDFGMTYGTPDLVGDDVHIRIETEAMRMD